jgi:hypothetical protein
MKSHFNPKRDQIKALELGVTWRRRKLLICPPAGISRKAMLFIETPCNNYGLQFPHLD